MTVKRSREDRAVEALAMANCLMLLSNMAKTTASPPALDRVFACKTCNKRFPSFQALGGHRASHKRARLLAADGLHDQTNSPAKPKTHECPICGLEFPLGQALGGHMRRHRNDMSTAGDKSEETQSGSQKSNSHSDSHRALLFDLNLTPRENHFKFGRLDSLV